MQNKHQKMWGYGVMVGSLLGAMLLGWLTLPATRGISGIPRQVKYQPPAGEQVIATNQDAAPLADTELDYQGHRYRLDIKIDQPSISPLAGSFITGKIQLLKDGSPTQEVPDFMINSRFPTSGIPMNQPIVLVDLYALNQRMQLDNTQPRAEQFKIDDDIGWPIFGGIFNWSRVDMVGFTKAGEPNRSSPYMFSAWDKVLFSPQALNTVNYNTADFIGVLDFTGGQTTFRYQHNGMQVAPYLELVVKSFSDKIRSTKRVNFQGKGRGVVTVPQPTSLNQKTATYYEVVTSRPSLAAGTAERFSIGVVARKANGSVDENPRQRVRLTVMPMSMTFLPQGAKAASYGQSPANNAPTIVGSIQIKTAGKFILNDDTKYKYAALSPTDALRGESSSLQEDPTAIELDLVEGKATVDFEYSGKNGPLPYLAITVQPTSFFWSYTGWNASPPASPSFKQHSWDAIAKDCEDNNSCSPWDAERRAYVNAPSYNREVADITYPPFPEQSDNPNPAVCDINQYHYSTSSGACYALYQDTWYPQEEFFELMSNMKTIKLLPINSSDGSQVQWAWWWFISIQVIQLAVWSIKVIIEKRKLAHGNA